MATKQTMGSLYGYVFRTQRNKPHPTTAEEREAVRMRRHRRPGQPLGGTEFALDTRGARIRLEIEKEAGPESSAAATESTTTVRPAPAATVKPVATATGWREKEGG